jgi:hypothetical protein
LCLLSTQTCRDSLRAIADIKLTPHGQQMTSQSAQLLIGALFLLISGSTLSVGLVTGKMIAPSGTIRRSTQPLRFWHMASIYILGTIVGLFVLGSALNG